LSEIISLLQNWWLLTKFHDKNDTLVYWEGLSIYIVKFYGMSSSMSIIMQGIFRQILTSLNVSYIPNFYTCNTHKIIKLVKTSLNFTIFTHFQDIILL
jgi:hypothetical protein